MSPRTSGEPGRLAAIDGLRGIAAMGVVVFHLWPDHLFWLWSMVDLFFVISGLVITRMLLEVRHLDGYALRSFWIRRALRIWPVYYLTLVACLAAGSALHAGGMLEKPHSDGLWKFFAFLQFTELYDRDTSIMDISYLLFFFHSWSLAVEEQFYLVWPLVVAALRRRLPLLEFICLALVAGGVIARIAGFEPQLLLTRMDGLALGALIAIRASRPAAGAGGARAAAALAAAAGIALIAHFLYTGYSLLDWRWMWDHYSLVWVVLGFNLLYAGLVAEVTFLESGRIGRLLSGRLLMYLGSISFALYMYHQPMLAIYKIALRELHAGRHLILDLGYVLATVGLAHLSRNYFERYWNGFKHRFPMSREGAARQTATDSGSGPRLAG